MSAPENIGDFLPEASPVVNLKLGNEEYSLSWDNTLLRTYLVGDGQYDHLIHQTPNGDHLFFLFDGDEGDMLKAYLEQNRFPIRVDPIVDGPTRDRFIDRQMFQLEKELKRALSEQ